MAAELIDGARAEKVYFPRIHPVERYRPDTFQKRFRLSKDALTEMAKLYDRSGYCPITSDCGGSVGAIDRMCLALRYLATGASYSVIADTQGVTKPTVHRAVHEVIDFFASNQHLFIKWPRDYDERCDVSGAFYEKFGGVPGVLGCVDGTHIGIVGPNMEARGFLNRKGYHSINAMAICDADMLFMHLDCRFAGSVHDSYIFRMSRVYQKAEEGLYDDFYLLGDSGYPLKDYLFTPYSAPETEPEKKYNMWQRSTRNIVENAFGVLKQRWRCLDDTGGLLHHSPEVAAKIIIACVCLHNFCRLLKFTLPREEDYGDFDRVRPGYRPRRVPVRRVQPPRVVLRQRVRLQARENLVQQFFGPDAPNRKRKIRNKPNKQQQQRAKRARRV